MSEKERERERERKRDMGLWFGGISHFNYFVLFWFGGSETARRCA